MWCTNCGQMTRVPAGSVEVVKSRVLFSPANARMTTEAMQCAYCKGEWLFTNSKARGEKYANAAQERMTKDGHDDFSRLRLGKK